MSEKLKEAVSVLVTELNADKSEGSYYHTWQANIAMCFFDECKEQGSQMESSALAKLCNDGAKRFLEHLCYVGNKPDEDETWDKRNGFADLDDYPELREG